MLQHIEIKNFLRIPYLSLEVKRPVLFACGWNEAGKSSLAESIRFVLLGDSPRVSLKRDLSQLITHGAKRGSVDLAFEGAQIKRNIRDGKATGDTDQLPTDDLMASICLGATHFHDLKVVDRRHLLMRLMDVDLTADRVEKELLQRGFTETVVSEYRPLFANSMSAAHSKAKKDGSEKRGAWNEVTGQRWGREKGGDWTAERAPADIKELEGNLTEIDAEIASIQASRDQELAPVLTKIQQLRREETAGKATPGTACPSCGTLLEIENGTIKEFVEREKPKSNKVQIAVQEKKATEIREKFEGQLTELREGAASIRQSVNAERDAQTKEKRSRELHKQICQAESLEELFGEGDESILGRLVSRALHGFNQRLAYIAESIGWEPVTVAADMTIERRDRVPYDLLSESAKWRADAMMITVISELAEFPWLIFDRMDILDIPNRVRFLKWCNRYGVENEGATLVVLATLKERPNIDKLEGIQWHWLERGEVD